MIGRPLFFFCDANTVVYDTHLLAKKGGPEVVRLLRALRAQIAVPEVSRAEYLSNYAKVASSAHEDAEVVLSKLETLSGQRVTAALPQAKFWEARGPKILDDLKDCAGLISMDTSIGGIHLDGENTRCSSSAFRAVVVKSWYFSISLAKKCFSQNLTPGLETASTTNLARTFPAQVVNRSEDRRPKADSVPEEWR